jgi:hypothetical protein
MHRKMVRMGSNWNRKLGFFIAFAYGALTLVMGSIWSRSQVQGLTR